MRNFKKIIALIVAVITVMSCAVPMVQAADPKLTHRKDFDWGVVMHEPKMSMLAYNTGYLEEHIHLAAEMGSKLIRIDAKDSIGHLDKLVMLANSYGMKVMLIVYIPGKTLTGEYDIDLIQQHYYTYATRYNGKTGHGKAAYIQIDNEMDVTLMRASSKGETGGQNKTDYNEVHLRTLSGQVKAALKGVEMADTDAKTIINFGWTHWGMFDYFIEDAKLNWDIIGYDWYSDMFQANQNPNNYFWAGDIVYERYKKKIVICETNMNGNVINKDSSPAEVNKWHNNASNWDPLVKCMEHYYNKDYVIGCTFYEFCDELEREGATYEPEAHYGLVFTDKNTGAVISPKPIYYRIQKMIGGGTVKKLDWSKVLATYKDDEEEDEIGQNNNSQSGNVNVITNQIHIGGNNGNSQNSGTTNQTGSGDTITEIFREEDATGTGESNKTFTLPIIICLVAGGLIVLLAIGLGVFFILRKPKSVLQEIPEAETTNENE